MVNRHTHTHSKDKIRNFVIPRSSSNNNDNDIWMINRYSDRQPEEEEKTQRNWCANFDSLAHRILQVIANHALSLLRAVNKMLQRNEWYKLPNTSEIRSIIILFRWHFCCYFRWYGSANRISHSLYMFNVYDVCEWGSRFLLLGEWFDLNEWARGGK